MHNRIYKNKAFKALLVKANQTNPIDEIIRLFPYPGFIKTLPKWICA